MGFSDLERGNGKSRCLWLEVPLYLCCTVLQEEGWVVQPRPRQRQRSGPTLCSCAQPCAASMAPVWLPGPSSPPRSCSMGREGKSRLLVYSFMLPDTVPWSTAVWEGKESHVYWCIGACYQTLSVLWNTAVLEERASRAYCCVVSCCQMLSVLWSTAVWGGKAIMLIVV